MGNFYPNLYNHGRCGRPSSGRHDQPRQPGLGTVPTRFWRAYQFYLNGIGIPGQNGIPKAW